MKHLAPLALAFGLAGLIVSPALAETENKRHYGNCTVATERDEFTDEISHHSLSCGPHVNVFPLTHPTPLFFDFTLFCGRQPWNGIMLRVELQSHLNSDSIRVRYRWGKKKAQSEIWEWKHGNTMSAAIGRNADTFNRFLEGLATTKRLVIQVGDYKSSRKILDGIPDIKYKGEAPAVPDFKARCGKE